jgi:PIF1-like helicase
MACCRSLGYIVVCCAATTLAANLYPFCETAHSCFKFPVIEDMDRDYENGPECQFTGQRQELLESAKVIIWDEFVTNHKEIYESARKKLSILNPKCVWICTGDFHQCLPIVKGMYMLYNMNNPLCH